jgi:hypothetical protein
VSPINTTDLVPLQNGDGEEQGGGLSLRDYSPNIVVLRTRRLLRNSDAILALGKFDPTIITMRQRYLMRKDTMIQMGLHYRKVPLINGSWRIDSEDKQQAAFATKALEPIYTRLVTKMCTAWDFGYAGLVQRYRLADIGEARSWTYEDESGNVKKVWPSTSVRPVVWNEPRVLTPDGLEPMFNEAGTTFTGMKHSMLQDANGLPLEVPASHSLWMTYRKDEEFEDWYGYPLTGFGLRYWWSYWYNWLLRDRHFEQDADPPLLVRVPAGVVPDPTDPTGQRMISTQTLGLMIGQDLRDGATVVFPSTPYKDPVDGKMQSVQEWSADFLKGGENLQAFRSEFEYMDVMKLRSLMVPEQALIEGKGGTGAKNVVGELANAYVEAEALDMDLIAQHINDFMLPRLLKQNFIDPAPARFVPTGFRQEDMSAATDLLTIIAQQDLRSLGVDPRRLAKMLGVPQLSPEEQKRRDAEAAGPTPLDTPQDPNQNPDAAAGTPQANGIQNNPAATPAAGGNPAPSTTPTVAGISVTGFALDHQTGQELPDTGTFQDPVIASLADQAYTTIFGFMDEMVAGATQRLEVTLPEDGTLHLAWQPDLHPRWPAHTPGSKGGEFAAITVPDIIKRLAGQPSGTINMSFLARGSANITDITARRKGAGVNLGVTLRDGRKGSLQVDPDVNFDNVMGELARIDAGKKAAAAAKAAEPAAPKAPTPGRPSSPEASGAPHPANRLYSGGPELAPDLQALVDEVRNDPTLAKWPPDKGHKAARIFTAFDDTQSMYSYVNPENDVRTYTADRRKEHERIISLFLAGHKPQAEKHILLQSGGPASGKSSGQSDIIPEDAVHVDVDAIRAELPEYKLMIGEPDSEGNYVDADRYAAYGTHEESSDIAAELVRRATAKGLNVIIDGTGDSDPFKFSDKIDKFTAMGYKVDALLADAPAEVAFARSALRGHRTGRFLPHNFVITTHRMVAASHLIWRENKNLNSWQMFSNDVPKGSDPLLVAEGGLGKFDVTLQELYDQFVAKTRGEL